MNEIAVERDLLDAHAQLDDDAERRERRLQARAHLRVEERKQTIASFEQRDLDVHRREHRRVLAADHAAADDDHALRQAIEEQDGVGVRDVRAERDVRRLKRHGARRDEDHFARQRAHDATCVVEHFDRVRILHARAAVHELDLMTIEVLLDAIDLELAHFVFAREELRHGRVFLERHAEPVELALAITGQEERGLAQRLRWKRSGVDRRAARFLRALDDGDALLEIRSLRRAFFAGGSTADHDEIENVAHLPPGFTISMSQSTVTSAGAAYGGKTKFWNACTTHVPTGLSPYGAGTSTPRT